MKDNNSKNKQNKNIYIYNNNDSEDNIKNTSFKNNKKDDSLHKYYKTLEDTHESYELLKQLEILNLSEKKSFDLPKKITINLNKNNDSILGKTKANKGNKKEKRYNNRNNEEQIYNNIQKEDKSETIKLNIEEEFSNREENQQLSEFLLREKLNRICASIQGYTLNQKCYDNLNNFIPYISEISQNLYQPLDLLFDVFIELLNRIKQEFNVKENLIHKLNDISINNEGYEKKLLKLKKEIKEKDKEIGSLLNNLNIEKENANNDSKSKILEINSLKKENQQLNNKLNVYKSQIKKSEAEYKLIENKLKYYIFEKENKTNLTSSFENNNEEKNKNEFKIKNEKYLAIKKLNMNLVYLLKDINKSICKYDFSLNKIINDNNKRNNYEIDDLSNKIESNLLIDENKCKNFCKNFLFNMDLINNKIIDILKLKDDWIKANNNNNTNIFKSQDFDNKSDKLGDSFFNQKEEVYNNKKNNKDKYNNTINASSSNKINLQKNNNMNHKNVKNNFNNSEIEFNKIGRNTIKAVNQKYDCNSKNYNKTITNRSERKKNTINFLNFYSNEDKNLESNNEKKTIDPKWYENFKNKKVGYVFDKNKLFTCNDEDDRTNGANRK